MLRRRQALAGGLLLLVMASPAFAAPQTQAPAPAPAPATAPAAPTQEEAHRITGIEARQALAKGTAVLVDVRSKESYNASHAEGALSIPLSDIGSRAAELPKDKLVITYCT
jgi:3-mercaptopyruvate sulfurtransferase SseA